MAWVALAIIFAAVWIYALYREDLRNPEPLWMVLLATGGGMLAVPAAGWVEGRLMPNPALLDGTLAERAGAAFLISGPVEEGLKLLAILLLVWPWTHFDEPVDGIVYAAAAGAGFALIENLWFMEGQPEVILARGPIGTGAHVLFAGVWGGAMGHARQLKGGPQRLGIVALGLVLGALAHGAFNLITLSTSAPDAARELTLNQGRLAQIALMVACFLFLRWRLRVALREAPFRFRRPTAS